MSALRRSSPTTPPDPRDEALRLAREALEFIRDDGMIEETVEYMNIALASIDALKE